MIQGLSGKAEMKQLRAILEDYLTDKTLIVCAQKLIIIQL